MTIWTPTLANGRPAYQALADAIAADRKAGRLKPGDKLPPHRDLAYALGLTVGTVTRGYAEAARRGLARGEVGRGTFVLDAATRPTPADAGFVRRQAFDADFLNLTITRPALDGMAAHVQAALKRLADHDLDPLIDYATPEGLPQHREAVAAWLRRRDVDVEADRIVVTSGAQNALAIAAAGLFRPGDKIAVDPLTYPGFASSAGLFGLNLVAVEGDADGMLPDALARAAAQGCVGVYLMPTLHNPTMATMPSGRRAEIAAVADATDLLILEDDVYGFLAPNAPARFVEIAPDRTALIGSVSKFAAPALRIGWIAAPPGRAGELANALRGLAWMASPLLADIAAEALASGLADELAEAQRMEAAARMAIAHDRLGPWLGETPLAAMHVWLRLPEPWRRDAFVAEADARRIAITGASAFAVGRTSAPHAIRFGLGPASRERLDQGLATLAGLLEAPPRAGAGAAVV